MSLLEAADSKAGARSAVFYDEDMVVSTLLDSRKQCAQCSPFVRGSSSMAIVYVGCAFDDSHSKAVGGDSSKRFLTRSQCSDVDFEVIGCSWSEIVVGIE